MIFWSINWTSFSLTNPQVGVWASSECSGKAALPRGSPRSPILRTSRLLLGNCCQCQNEPKTKMKWSLRSHLDFNPNHILQLGSAPYSSYLAPNDLWLFSTYKCTKKQICSDVWGLVLLCFVVVWLLSHVRLFATLWTAAHQASLSSTLSQSLLKLAPI